MRRYKRGQTCGAKVGVKRSRNLLSGLWTRLAKLALVSSLSENRNSSKIYIVIFQTSQYITDPVEGPEITDHKPSAQAKIVFTINLLTTITKLNINHSFNHNIKLQICTTPLEVPQDISVASI